MWDDPEGSKGFTGEEDLLQYKDAGAPCRSSIGGIVGNRQSELRQFFTLLSLSCISEN